MTETLRQFRRMRLAMGKSPYPAATRIHGMQGFSVLTAASAEVRVS
jgi:hypothetical protein